MKKLLFFVVALVLAGNLAAMNFNAQAKIEKNDRGLTEGFEWEEISTDWTIINEDGDTKPWVLASDSPHSGAKHMAVSYNGDGNNDWLISPQITVGSGEQLSFWAKSGMSSFKESYNVLISETGTAIADFTSIDAVEDAPAEYTEKTYDLTAYEGKAIHVAIQCVSVNEFKLCIDDFSVAVPAADVAGPTVVNLGGNSVAVDEVMNLTLEVEDATGVASVVGTATINGTESQVPMTAAVKKIKMTKKGPKTVFVYTGSIAAMTEAATGTIVFAMTDTAGDGNLSTSDPLTLEWVSMEGMAVVEGFEGDVFPPAAWTSNDSDGDGNDWMLGEAPGASTHGGTKSANSASYVNEKGAVTPDNWLITPKIINPTEVKYWVSAQDAEWAGEKYGVFVSTTGTDPADFTEVFVETMTAKATGAWYERTVDLSAYAAENAYVAFRHFDCTDMFMLNLDDVVVMGDGVVTDPVEDTDAPVFVSLSGNDVTVGTDMALALVVEDATGVPATIQADYDLAGAEGVLTMNLLEVKGQYSYTGTITSPVAAASGNITFHVADTAAEANLADIEKTISFSDPVADTTAPALVSLTGTTAAPNEDMNLVLTLTDETGVATPVVATYNVAGSDMTIDMDMVTSKTVNMPVDIAVGDTKATRADYVFTATIPAQVEGTVGTVSFAFSDTAVPANDGTIDPVEIKWEAETPSDEWVEWGETYDPAAGLGVETAAWDAASDFDFAADTRYLLGFEVGFAAAEAGVAWKVVEMVGGVPTDNVVGTLEGTFDAEAGVMTHVDAKNITPITGQVALMFASAGNFIFRDLAANSEHTWVRSAAVGVNDWSLATSIGDFPGAWAIRMNVSANVPTPDPDTEAPVASTLTGTKVDVDQPMVLTLQVSDATGVASVVGTATIDGTDIEVPMTAAGKVMRDTKKGPKAVFEFTGTIAAQPAAVIGKVVFAMTDTADPANSGTSPEFDIEWEFVPTDLIVDEGFEGDVFPPENWATSDMDGDGNNWEAIAADNAFEGANLANSASYVNEKGALTPDNWLVTPHIIHPTKIEWQVSAQDADWAGEKYGLYVSTTGPSVYDDFTEVFVETMTAKAQGAWYAREFDLSAYAGQSIYLAFRHYETTDMFRLNLDEIKIYGDGVDGIEDMATPVATALEQNYPNPFNPSTTIRFSTAAAGNVQLAVFNVKGELVANLVNREMTAGHQNVQFNAGNLNSGVYYYTLKTAGKSITKKMVLVK